MSMVFTCLLIIFTLAIQIVLSFIFNALESSGFTKGFIDLSMFFCNIPGELTIYYTDIIRIMSFVVLLIPYMFALMKVIEKTIVNPLKEITKGIDKVDYNKLSKRLDIPTKYEFTELKNTFNQLLDRLEKSNKAQIEAEEQKKLLITGMAHDLKTPITTIRGYSQALNEGVLKDDQQKKEYLIAINRKSIQLDCLISILFDYAKLSTTTKGKLEFESLDLVELIRENIALFYTEFEENQIRFEFDIPDNKVIIQGDRKQLNRVFANIYTNALKHNQPGDVVKTTLDLMDGITICVEDTGDEIPEHIAKHIFQPFVTGDNSRKAGSGSGLGLSIALKIIELHHGTMFLEQRKHCKFTKKFVIKLEA